MMSSVSNRTLWLVVSGALILFVLILYIPFLTALFQLVTPGAAQMLLCLSVSLAAVFWFEVYKVISARRLRGAAPASH